ncbi:hypothetical protein FDX00_10945 [Citrobacter sp. wls617]|nr:hypothetical protein AL515_23460 [Citrobacter sp. FDAARGOS_156]AYL63128.1 hypothetical protein CUC49_16580 [Citrobacter pasteurii]NHM12175.1 hypothetical protein [Citrobacter youngae]TKU93485.1 hypothetical protein FDX00_10945 [Citrobacter sp. wls617]RPH21288.1 hypothetical protein EHN13_22920 [Citrobacter youngae]
MLTEYQCLPAASCRIPCKGSFPGCHARRAYLPAVECKKPRNVLRGFYPLPGREKLIQQRC